jgi:hypothetical protein
VISQKSWLLNTRFRNTDYICSIYISNLSSPFYCISHSYTLLWYLNNMSELNIRITALYQYVQYSSNLVVIVANLETL